MDAQYTTGGNQYRTTGVPGCGPQENMEMTTHLRQPTTAAAYRAGAIANSVEANERRRRRGPRVIDWNKAIANMREILDDDRHPDD